MNLSPEPDVVVTFGITGDLGAWVSKHSVGR
jgi:hypothetical protein